MQNSKSEPNSSKNELVTTIQNLNDLQNIEFNSADDVRQKMKVLANTISNFNSEDSLETLKNDKSTLKGGDFLKPLQILEEEQGNVNDKSINEIKRNTQSVQVTEVRVGPKNVSVTRKRPGRPPKVGTSRKNKKKSVFSLYIGKLSNLRRRCRSDSDSYSDIS